MTTALSHSDFMNDRIVRMTEAGVKPEPVCRKRNGVQWFLRLLFRIREEKNPPAILIAGGGTGGHLFPGIAIAESLLEKDPHTRILFVSTGNDFEKAVLSEKGFALETIRVEGIKGRGIMAKVRSLFKIPGAMMASVFILKRFRPCLVIGMGSYSSGPVALAAWMMGIPVVLHEQNIRPGITNRMLSRIADRIYVSFQGTQTVMEPEKIRILGNPVRKEIREANKSLEENRQSGRSGSQELMTIVVIGGSQGAHRINTAVMEALPHLAQEGGCRFIHQTGKADEAVVREAYAKAGIAADVGSFFHDMAQLYAKADLLICRAGATTVAEVTSIGKGAIFIPYPYAADNHQVLNAQALVDEGAAEIILEEDLSGAVLAEKIRMLSREPDRIREMNQKARMFGRPEAAAEIAADVYTLIENE